MLFHCVQNDVAKSNIMHFISVWYYLFNLKYNESIFISSFVHLIMFFKNGINFLDLIGHRFKLSKLNHVFTFSSSKWLGVPCLIVISSENKLCINLCFQIPCHFHAYYFLVFHSILTVHLIVLMGDHLYLLYTHNKTNCF